MTVAATSADGMAVRTLVIEYVSGWCEYYPGADIEAVSRGIPQGMFTDYFVPVETYGPNSLNVVASAFAQETRLYAATEKTISFVYNYALDGPNVSNFCTATLVGHYVVQ